MLKYLVNLLTTAISLVTALLVANISLAAPTVSPVVNKDIAPSRQVSLNLLSPELARATAKQDSQFPHLGCSCAACTQGIERANQKLTA